ncbi:hypothetical protein [Phenylobacterium sp.]|uniref:hypothetical protein n=1 Tax=Phenylobacterium sp. TaxID=1871053 RepID=UPI002733CFD2|nr:hypothetical protein [Phenylobacterium sp.]MDP3852546.1 hypothetical protein [Phenylobacterium sp.]
MTSPMTFMQMVVGADAAAEHVVLQLNRDGETLGDVALSAADAEAHIEAVALYRAQLKTPVAAAIDPMGRIEATNNPVWTTLSTPHGPVLSLRHPGLGWVSFVFPASESRALGKALIDLADRAEAKG